MQRLVLIRENKKIHYSSLSQLEHLIVEFNHYKDDKKKTDEKNSGRINTPSPVRRSRSSTKNEKFLYRRHSVPIIQIPDDGDDENKDKDKIKNVEEINNIDLKIVGNKEIRSPVRQFDLHKKKQENYMVKFFLDHSLKIKDIISKENENEIKRLLTTSMIYGEKLARKVLEFYILEQKKNVVKKTKNEKGVVGKLFDEIETLKKACSLYKSNNETYQKEKVFMRKLISTLKYQNRRKAKKVENLIGTLNNFRRERRNTDSTLEDKKEKYSKVISGIKSQYFDLQRKHSFLRKEFKCNHMKKEIEKDFLNFQTKERMEKQSKEIVELKSCIEIMELQIDKQKQKIYEFSNLMSAKRVFSCV